jgi:DNA-directed RNA polymerase beta subunit
MAEVLVPFRKLVLLFIILNAWGMEGDEEIIKNLDFFMNYEVVENEEVSLELFESEEIEKEDHSDE